MERRNPIGAGGKLRRPSSMHAFMYGRLSSIVLARRIRSSLWKALRISCFSLEKTRGCRRRLFISAARELAVVSLPATLFSLAGQGGKGREEETYMKSAALTMTSSCERS